jgi:hypothetical protein
VSENWTPTKCALIENLGSDCITDVMLHGRSRTGLTLSTHVGHNVTVSKWGGWTIDQGTHSNKTGNEARIVFFLPGSPVQNMFFEISLTKYSTVNPSVSVFVILPRNTSEFS